MSEVTIGSLCSGYGGLDRAVEEFFGARTAWFAEYEDAPSKVLAAHWPGVPNLGDITQVDWQTVPRVRIVCGGTPCQDLSGAGKRAGMTEGTRSNLWVQMREAVATIRPDIVIWENVRGAFSAYAASDVESEPGLLGEAFGPDRPALRGLGRVLGDLSDLGYDTEWVGVRASDVGAPHGRFRVFVLAYAQSMGLPGFNDGSCGDETRGERDGFARGGDRLCPAADTGRVSGQLGRDAGDMDGSTRPGESAWDQRERHGNATEHRSATDWGEYEPAIRCWERALGRVAPAPTEPGAARNGSRRLSPRFEEWMMGLPDGWVTDSTLDLTWGEQVKMLGNGVVPQQALHAFSILWPRVIEQIGVAA